MIQLEDLALHFNLKTQEAIDRIQNLQEIGRLTGKIFLYFRDHLYYIFIKIIEISGNFETEIENPFQVFDKKLNSRKFLSLVLFLWYVTIKVTVIYS